jgi:hypothetical protein
VWRGIFGNGLVRLQPPPQFQTNFKVCSETSHFCLLASTSTRGHAAISVFWLLPVLASVRGHAENGSKQDWTLPSSKDCWGTWKRAWWQSYTWRGRIASKSPYWRCGPSEADPLLPHYGALLSSFLCVYPGNKAAQKIADMLSFTKMERPVLIVGLMCDNLPKIIPLWGPAHHLDPPYASAPPPTKPTCASVGTQSRGIYQCPLALIVTSL